MWSVSVLQEGSYETIHLPVYCSTVTLEMALSWIFSGKKKEEKPIPVTVEAVEVGTDDDYTLIQANPLQPSGLYPQVPHSPYPPAPYIPLPYSVLPHREHQQSNSNTRSCVQNQLDGIPFVLNPALEQSSKKNYLIGIEDLRRAVFQIAADISDPMYDYDFKTEHNIMREASVYNHDN